MSDKTTILIVDDEQSARDILGMLLRNESYCLLFAADGGSALEQAAAHLPDLVLLDVMMPQMDGYEVTRQLRATPALAEVPIILVTALDDRDSRLAGLEAGADDFITKPYDRSELRARIRAITRLNRYRRLVDERSKSERVIELAPNGLLVLDGDEAVRLANPALLRLLGRSPNDTIIGATLRQFVAPAAYAQWSSELHTVATNSAQIVRFESMLLGAEGVELPVEIDAGYVDWDGQPALQVSIRDIRERRNAEARIQRQIDRLAALRTIDATITASFDLSVTLNVVLGQILEHLHVDAAAVLLPPSRARTLKAALVRGVSRHALRYSSLQVGKGYAGRVAVERRTLTLDDLAESESLPVLIDEPVAAYFGVPLIVKGQVDGVLEIFHHSPLNPDSEWLDFLEVVAGQAAIAIDHASLFHTMQRTHAELAQAYEATLEGWARALELRDKETAGHTQRVSDLTVKLARHMGVSEAELVHIRRGALLHDIGKMGIPDRVLLKPGPLSDEEWVIMRQHPVYAYEMLAPITYLKPALDIPYCHHEKWDGTGYPRGLQGEQIPLAARMFAVVDVWDALTSDRPYRKHWPEEKVRDYIRAHSGSHFDPQVVSALLQLSLTESNTPQLAILVVDNEPTMIDLLQRTLHDNYRVYTAACGEDALTVLEHQEIAVIITDQWLQGLTGVQLLEQAQQMRPRTLGILCSGHSDNEALTRALNLGTVRGYLQKPWSALELRQRVNEVAQQYAYSVVNQAPMPMQS